MSERRKMAIASFKKHHPKSLTLHHLEALHCWGSILGAVVKDGLQSFWIDLITSDKNACFTSLNNDAFRRSLLPDERFRLMQNAAVGKLDGHMVAYYGRVDAPEYLPKRERRRLTAIACKANPWSLRRRAEDGDSSFDRIERIIIWWHCSPLRQW